MQDAKNPNARNMLIQGEVTPEQFLNMDPREFASDRRKDSHEKHKGTAFYEKRSDWDVEMVKQAGDKHKGMFPCDACGSDKTGFI